VKKKKKYHFLKKKINNRRTSIIKYISLTIIFNITNFINNKLIIIKKKDIYDNFKNNIFLNNLS